MKLLCRTIGIGAATVFVWGGKQDRRITYVFNRGGTLLSPTIRITTNRTDGAEKHPHFRLHVQVKVDPGRFFDPSYGTEGLVNVSETAPGAQVKVADALVFPVAHSRWTCPHGARMAPVVRHPQGTEPRPISPNPDELIAGVEISPLIERILPGNTLVGRRPQRYGLAYRFSAAPGGPTHEVAIGVLPTTADASGAFDELKDRSQAPPESLAIGDEGVVWRPLPELDRTGGSLLFRRKNALVYLRGELDQDRREMLASEIDRRFIFSPPDEPWVKRGTPLVPKVSVPASLAIDRHSRPLEMGLRIEYPALDDLIVFTPDVDVARIYDRSTLLFYPPGPGVHQCTIFALTPLNVVGSATVSIEVENPPA
jgi:hypothetical protein